MRSFKSKCLLRDSGHLRRISGEKLRRKNRKKFRTRFGDRKCWDFCVNGCGPESFAQIKKIFSTNLSGVLNLISPAINKMKIRKKGQLALISSLAGFRGLPSSPAYSGSKAAVRVYGEALRGNLAPLGIEVNVVCPGYVKTPMTDVNEFPMPFLISAEKCAAIIKRDLEKNKSRIAFPFPLYFVVWLSALLSTKITDPIFARLPGKKAL